MHALSHYAEKKKSAFDEYDFPLAQMKKKGTSLVWRVKFYGRSVSRAKPALSAEPCKEFADGDYVEVTDYHLKWLKIQHRSQKGKIEKGQSWLLAVDLWSNSDLVVMCDEGKSAKVRAKWDKRNKKKRSPNLYASPGQAPASSPLSLPSQLPPPSGPMAGPALPDALQLKAAKLSRQKALEEEERLRKIRLSVMTQKAPPSMPELEYVDDPNLQPRSAWIRGSKVSVWSASQKKWFPGVIVKIADEGTPKEKVTVHYKSAGRKSMKIMPRLSKMIRSRAAKSSPTNSATNQNGDVGNVQSPNGDTTTSMLAAPNAVEQNPSSDTQPPSSSKPGQTSGEESTTAAPAAATERAHPEEKKHNANSDLPPIPASAECVTASDTADSDYAEEAAAAEQKEPPMPDPNQLPVGWTEHLDKRSGRYYYNNRATSETLWDTMAVKRGIISKVRPG